MDKPKWLDDHACAYNDGECECKCFKTAYLQALREAVGVLEKQYEEEAEDIGQQNVIYKSIQSLESLLTKPKDK